MTQTQDRTPATPDVATMSGLELLEAMRDGLLPYPPISETLGFDHFVVAPGEIEVGLVAGVRHYNAMGGVHGGVVASLLDTAAACAVQSTLAAGEGYTSLDLTVKFLRPATVESGALRAVGTVLQRGRRTALAQAQLLDARDRLVAHATSSCMIFAPAAG